MPFSYIEVEDAIAADGLALFAPLPEEHCAMNPNTREGFNIMNKATRAALDPILLEHRDRMYAQHLELPLNL